MTLKSFINYIFGYLCENLELTKVSVLDVNSVFILDAHIKEKSAFQGHQKV